MCMSRPTALRLAYCCVKGHVRLCSKCKPPLPPAKASGSGKCCDTFRLTKGIVANYPSTLDLVNFWTLMEVNATSTASSDLCA